MICGLYLYSSKPLSKRYPLSHKLMGGGGDALVVGALLTTNDDTIATPKVQCCRISADVGSIGRGQRRLEKTSSLDVEARWFN